MGWTGNLKKTLFGGQSASKMDLMTGGQKSLLGMSTQLGQQYLPGAYGALGQMAGNQLTEDLWQTRYQMPMMRQFEVAQRETNQALAGRSGFHGRMLGAMRMDQELNQEAQYANLRGNVEQSYDMRRMQAAMGLGSMASSTLDKKAHETVVSGDSGLFGALAQIGVTAAAGKSMFS